MLNNKTKVFVLKLKDLFPFFQETVFAMLVETTGNRLYFVYMNVCPITVRGSHRKVLYCLS